MVRKEGEMGCGIKTMKRIVENNIAMWRAKRQADSSRGSGTAVKEAENHL